MIILSVTVVLIVIFLSFSAFFSASETALFSIPRERILYFQNNDSRKHYRVYLLLKEGQKTLLLILLGNIFVNITLAGLIHKLLQNVLPHGSTFSTLIIATVVIVLFGEMLPKNIALKNNELIATTISPALYYIERVFTPALKVIQKINLYFLNLFKSRLRMPSPFITIEELKTAIESSTREGAISSQEQGMIIGILEQGSEPVRKVMVHRSNLLIVDEDCAVEQVLKKMTDERQELVIVRSSIDHRHVRGVVHVKDCVGIQPNDSIGSRIVTPVVWVPETIETADLIGLLLTEKYEEVCIIDQFGCFSGIISLTSCFSGIAANAFPGEKKETPVGTGRIFEGLQEIALIEEWLPRSLTVLLPGVRTLNGLLTNYIGSIPKSGDRVAIDGYNFYIIKSGPTRIESVLISKGT